MMATAPANHRFLLLEIAGPWPRQAVTGSWPQRSGLAADDAAHLDELTQAAGIRMLAIRRHERRPRPADDGHIWIMAELGPGGGVHTRSGRWGSGADLLALELSAGAQPEGLSPGPANDRPPGPLALVCTHGSRDACCAVLGRPVVAALAAHPELDVWECSHLGGHRFAGNVLMLGSGALYGRVDPEGAARVAAAELAGRVELSLLRGRCGMSALRQAADILVRRHWAEDRVGAVRVGEPAPVTVDGDGSVDAVTAAGEATRYSVLVSRDGDGCRYRAVFEARAERSGPVSCGQTKTETVSSFTLVGVQEEAGMQEQAGVREEPTPELR